MRRSSFRAVLGLLALTSLSHSAALAAASSPEKLRAEAMELFERTRSSRGDVRPDLLLARRKVKEAIAILESKRSSSKREKDRLVELQSLLYWIMKMTPLELHPETPPPAPPAGKKARTEGERTEGERPPEPPPRAVLPPPRPRPTGFSSRFPGLPAYLEPSAVALKKRYERGYASAIEVDRMRYAFWQRSLRQAFLLQKKPERALEAAALVFQAIDEHNMNFVGDKESAVRMQACLELDRLSHTAPGGALDPRALRLLTKGYHTLATSLFDAEPAIRYFEALRRAGLEHPDVKLGLALAKLSQCFVASQARVQCGKMLRFGRDKLGAWFGPRVGRMWCTAYRTYSNWSNDRLRKVSDESQQLFREYGRECPNRDIYVTFSECYWLWYWQKGTFLQKAAAFFRNFDQRDRADAEKTLLRVLIPLWMREKGHVDSDRVKWGLGSRWSRQGLRRA